MALTAELSLSQPPNTMECVSFCKEWKTQRDDVPRAAGDAKLYHGVSVTWGYVHMHIPDGSFDVSVRADAGMQAKLYESECPADLDSLTHVWLFDDTEFVWRMQEEDTTTWSAAVTYEVQVPLPDHEHGPKSIVVFDHGGAARMCCSLQKCVPPPEYRCQAACTTWLAHGAFATAVVGSSELWSKGLESWFFIDVAFEPTNKDDEVWDAEFEVLLFEGSPDQLGARTDPKEPLEKLPGLGAGSIGHMRLDAKPFDLRDQLRPDRPHTLVVSQNNQPLAVCQLETCPGRKVPQPGGGTGHEGGDSPVTALVCAVIVPLAVLLAALGFWRWRSYTRQRASDSPIDHDALCPTCLTTHVISDDENESKFPEHDTRDPCANTQRGVEWPSAHPTTTAEVTNPASYSNNGAHLHSIQDGGQREALTGVWPCHQHAVATDDARTDSDYHTTSEYELSETEHSEAQVPPTGSPHFQNAYQVPRLRMQATPRLTQNDYPLESSAQEALLTSLYSPGRPSNGHVSADNGSMFSHRSRSSGSMCMTSRPAGSQAVALFEEYMHDVWTVLSFMHRQLPNCASPVYEELLRLMSRWGREGDRYRSESHVAGSLYAWSAAAKLQQITCRVQQLLVLLVSCVAPADDLTIAEALLTKFIHTRRPSPSSVAPHLKQLRAFVVMMGESLPSEGDVDHRLRVLQRLTVQLKEPEIQEVQQVYCKVQGTLKCPLSTLSALTTNMTTCVSELSRLARSLRDQIKPITERLGMEGADIVQVLEQMNPEDDELCSWAGRLLMSADPFEFNDFIVVCKRSAQYGRVKMSFCFASGRPFSRKGEGEPVKLPCGCSVTRGKAEELKLLGKCCVCHRPFTPRVFPLEVDDTLLRIVQLGTYGLHLPSFSRDCIKLEHELGRGNQARVYAATLTQNGECQSVAVKEMVLKPYMSQRKPIQKAALHRGVTTMLVASENPHVCKMHGVSWSDESIWVVMEKCDSSLPDFVQQVKAVQEQVGLPAIDVLVLGWMLLDAVATVHDYAKSLHLDIKPDNVMLAPKQPDQLELRLRSIKLIDFGLGVDLATHASQVIPKCGAGNCWGWTTGYAPPEQMDLRQAQRATDVYAVGATMLFAATDQHPYGTTITPQGVMMYHMQGEQMPVPEYIPEGLRSLISKMTRLEPGQRPTLLQAQQEIVRLYLQQKEQGNMEEYLAPCWGMPTKEPADIES